MTEIFTGKTIEDAKAEAVAKFGVDESEILFEILEEPKKSLFGMKGIAKIQAEYIPSKMQIAINYIKNILVEMGVSATIVASENEGGAVLDLEGESVGSVIGRRGETLDALQYLASMVCNKGQGEYYRITVDSMGYREKRKQALEELAAKIAKNVIKSGYSAALEPMNPYERRIIHSTVSAIEGVSSRSVGEEPYRKVIISSTRKPRFEKNNRDNRDNRDRRGGNKNDFKGRKPKNTEGPRPLDLSTGFEKEYKKPLPEENIAAGLYGKIEF